MLSGVSEPISWLCDHLPEAIKQRRESPSQEHLPLRVLALSETSHNARARWNEYSCDGRNQTRISDH